MKRLAKVLLFMALLLPVLLAAGCAPQQIFLPADIVLFNLHEFGRVDQNVVYKCLQDVSLTMDIYHPSNKVESPVPGIIYIHGGGWYSGDKRSGVGQVDIPELLNRGYVVASVDYRLAPRYKFPAQIEDVICAVKFLRANADEYGIDPERIGVYGDSAGGHLAALLGLTGDSKLFDCPCGCGQESASVQAVVDIYGPADLSEICRMDKTPHMEHVFGTADPGAQLIIDASPVNHVHDTSTPFLIIHGDHDDQVLPEQSIDLYSRMTEADIPASLVIIENCEHGFIPTEGTLSLDRAEITDLIADFFDLALQDNSVPNTL